MCRSASSASTARQCDDEHEVMVTELGSVTVPPPPPPLPPPLPPPPPTTAQQDVMM